VDAEMDVDTDVVIVGFGPAGEMLASLLGQRGHRIVVFDKFPHPYGLPRMSTLDGEVARLLQHASDPREALAESLPQRTVELWGADGQRKGFFDWDYKRGGHWSHLSLHQPNIEAAMEKRIALQPNVVVHWGRSVTDLRTEGDHVVVTSRPSGDDGEVEGAAETVTARYVVGMDGASGFVRDAIGIDVEVLHRHDDRWVLTDYDVVAPLPNDLENRIFFELDLDQPYFFAPNGAGRVRTDVRMLPGDDAEVEGAEERGLDFLESRLGIPRDHVRQSRRKIYGFRSQIATAMRRGNVFIGGDAAHAMTPYMGQGACTAMRDAANLAWKLDLVLSGVVDEALLDTYEAERLAHSRFFVEGSLAAYKMVNPMTAEDAAARDGYLEATGGNVTPPIPPLRNGLQRRLDAGGSGRPTASDGDDYAPEAGTVAPQGVVAIDGVKAMFDDIVGYGFHLVSTLALDEALDVDRLSRLTELGVKRVRIGADGAEDIEGTYADYFSRHRATTLLSRPDGYVFGVANGPADTVDLVDALLAQLPRPHGLAGSPRRIA
jgi:3-(3-hydroxy-phenyl)propionate hydroxylase